MVSILLLNQTRQEIQSTLDGIYWEVWTVAVDVSNPIAVLITDDIAMVKEHVLEQP